MLKSKKKNKFTLFLFPYFAILGIFLLIFQLKEKIIQNTPFQDCIISSLIISTFISTGLTLIVTYKVITLNETHLKIKYPFLNKTFLYENNKIVGWKEFDNNKWFGKYKSFHLKTSDEKLYMFNQNEFSNYNELSISISRKFIETEISNQDDRKPILIQLYTIIFVFLLTSIIHFYNSK